MKKDFYLLMSLYFLLSCNKMPHKDRIIAQNHNLYKDRGGEISYEKKKYKKSNNSEEMLFYFANNIWGYDSTFNMLIACGNGQHRIALYDGPFKLKGFMNKPDTVMYGSMVIHVTIYKENKLRIYKKKDRLFDIRKLDNNSSWLMITFLEREPVLFDVSYIVGE